MNSTDGIARVINVRKKHLKESGFASLEVWLKSPQHLYIGRHNHYVTGATHSKWANPFPVKRHGLSRCLELYREWVTTGINPVTNKRRAQGPLIDDISELQGLVMGCWCKPSPCHGDVLVELLGDSKKRTAAQTSTSTSTPPIGPKGKVRRLSPDHKDSKQDVKHPSKPVNSDAKSIEPVEWPKLCHFPRRFVSGGQTGGDSIPLSEDFKKNGIGIAGWFPKGYKRDGGYGAEIAAKFGLLEGEGGYKWRDKANAEMSDACVGFLTSAPKTGRGSMMTINMFVNGVLRHVQLEKPKRALTPTSQCAVTIKNPCKTKGGRGHVFVAWDVSSAPQDIDAVAQRLREFLDCHKPKSLMFVGNTERVYQGLESIGRRVLLRALFGLHRETKDVVLAHVCAAKTKKDSPSDITQRLQATVSPILGIQRSNLGRKPKRVNRGLGSGPRSRVRKNKNSNGIKWQ